ncbi:class I adenylate-forming enzyme family protein [uncultured Arthrobacter sp.]|uniref:class I adenylate-forming enzyme family protein n=1 Tax=uncultured Arthrobacter sp. TaxID=114050 RepID=UPI00262BBAD8|nr:AMP-binding protein [uncultured Arthrobacter sp.]
MPFIDRLLHWARTEPDRDAVVVGDIRITYGELADRAARLQLPAGEMIGLLIDHPADFVVAFTAVVGRGRCAAVLDSGWPNDLQYRILDALEPDAVLTSTRLAQTSAGAYVAGTALSDAPADARFYCGFTSGTSGVPKGFVRTVGSWSKSLERSVDWFGLTPGLRVFAPGPLAASLTLYALAESLYSGATFHSAPPGTPMARGPAMAQVLRSERIEHFIGVPSALRLALGRLLGELPYLRTVVSGGSKLSAAETAIIRRRAPAARVFEYYGASELSLVTVRRADGAAGDDVGHPFPGVEIRIDADDLTNKPGGTGTIQVLTDTAIEGYLFGDDGRAFQRHGNWVTVQDRGWIDDDGALHLTGRHGDMVVVAGTNVYPSEIETILARAGYPAAVVLGIPDVHRGYVLAAVIEAPPETVLDAVGLRFRLKQLLPAVKVPQRLFRTVCLPLTAAGKPDRMALEAAVRAGGGGGVIEPFC